MLKPCCKRLCQSAVLAGEPPLAPADTFPLPLCSLPRALPLGAPSSGSSALGTGWGLTSGGRPQEVERGRWGGVLIQPCPPRTGCTQSKAISASLSLWLSLSRSSLSLQAEC